MSAEEPSQDRTREADQVPQPMRVGVGAPDYGPRNLARDRQNLEGIVIFHVGFSEEASMRQ
jgi:hypothetical protein